jgi:DNA-binding NarL/FixJ family response regulator
LLDAEIFAVDVALIDVRGSGIQKKETSLSFCEQLHQRLPDCHLLLLVSQEDRVSRKMAAEAKQRKIVEDFVFYDASLQYLFAKLSAF